MNSVIVGRAPPGLGKTTLAIKRAARSPYGPVEVYVSTHDLAAEVAVVAKGANPQASVRTIAGRSQIGADGRPLCKKYKLAEALAKSGVQIYSSLCERLKGSRVERCPHYTACPYINQFGPAHMTIYTHAHLPLQRSRLEPGVPSAAIIDESFFLACIETVDVPIALLRSPLLGPVGTRVCRAIESALQQGLPLFAHLRAAGIGYEELRDARNELSRRSPSISPGMPRTLQVSMLKSLGELSLLRRLLENVAHECVVARNVSHGFVYDAGAGKVTMHVKKPILRFHDLRRIGPSARVLILDGSADEEIINQFFDVGKFERIDTPRRARVMQCRSVRCSTTSLVPKRNSDRASRKAARRRLREVQAFIDRLAGQHARILVVGPQAITGNVRAKVKSLLNVPPNVDLAHFNAIRGIDRWKDHDAIVLIGRNEPPIKAVEAVARCVYRDDRAPLQLANEWTTEVRGYRTGKGRLGVDVVRHPDSRVQRVLEQLRESESLQAIDRLRLVHATTPKSVYLLSNLPLDVDVDELVTWDEMMQGSRLQRAWEALPGVMPLAPAWLASRFPQLWTTADAAKMDVARAQKECHFPNSISIRNLTLFQYRPVSLGGTSRQRSWSLCLSDDADVAVARQKLEDLTGAKVTMRTRPAK